MTTMDAIEIIGWGGPDQLRLTQRDVPQPGAGEVMVRVRATGVNRVDAFQRAGLYRPPAGTTDIPGVEFAGDVVQLGAGVTRFKPGDAICGIVVGGSYAGYCVAPQSQALPVPAGYSYVEAAAIAETFATVWTAIYDHGRLKPSESLLVHGGSSGIGTTAIMLARALGAGAIFTTAGSAVKCAACVDLGATRAINYRTEDFVSAVRQETGERGVDVILDMVAGDYIPKNISLLADDGRLVFVGRMSQQLEFSTNIHRIMYARLVITGVSLRGQTTQQKAAIFDQLAVHVWPLLAARAIAPVIYARFPLCEAAKAHHLLESSTHIGKIVLEVTH
jgi:NADPH2:quinone reductase